MEKVDADVKMQPQESAAQRLADLFHHFSDDGSPSIVSIGQPWLYTIWDLKQKYFVLMQQTLLAVPQDSNSTGFKPELMAVVPNRAMKQTSDQIFPIYMALEDAKHVLSCVESSGQPQLQLVENNIMNLYNGNQENKNFTFIAHTEGDTCSFESAAFPDQYISTSTEEKKPVGLSGKGGSEITTFYFKRIK